MIICSCNLFSDLQVRFIIANAARRVRVSQIYGSLGCSAHCGRCTHAIKRIIDEPRTTGSLGRIRRCRPMSEVGH